MVVTNRTLFCLRTGLKTAESNSIHKGIVHYLSNAEHACLSCSDA
jgi:hypothetical protein